MEVIINVDCYYSKSLNSIQKELNKWPFDLFVSTAQTVYLHVKFQWARKLTEFSYEIHFCWQMITSDSILNEDNSMTILVNCSFRG